MTALSYADTYHKKNGIFVVDLFFDKVLWVFFLINQILLSVIMKLPRNWWFH